MTYFNKKENYKNFIFIKYWPKICLKILVTQVKSLKKKNIFRLKLWENEKWKKKKMIVFFFLSQVSEIIFKLNILDFFKFKLQISYRLYFSSFFFPSLEILYSILNYILKSYLIIVNLLILFVLKFFFFK